MPDELTPVQNTEQAQGGNDSGTTPTAPDFMPITSQDDLNKIIAERVRRAKPGDYEDLKAKAARLDEIEAASKSELDKANERAAEAQARAEQAEHTALRARIQAKFAISDDDAELFLTGKDEDTLTRQAERLRDRTDNGQRFPLRVDHSGRTGSPAQDQDAIAREFFGL